MNRFFSSYDARYGVISVAPYYAMYTQRYMYEFDISPREIARLPTVLRENAMKNPYAQYRDPITVEDVLNSRIVCPPIHLLESAPLSDGAAAIVLASKEKAEELGHEPILITSLGEFHDASSFMPVIQDFTTFESVQKSAEEAFKAANIKPQDVDVAEVYGPFAGVELMIYEDLGFFKKGEAPGAVEEGKTEIEGEIPLNTSGGRLSLGHPWYVTPLLEVIEIVLQLRGQAGERQVPDARIGLVQCEHGAVNGSMVMILERG
jgi:acetyl-CoA acetyltransferase